MSKSTKIIAGLGVVAALGMAVMPLAGTFAESHDPAQASPVTNDVTVRYSIDETLSMTINNGTSAITHDKVDITSSTSDNSVQDTIKVSTNAEKGYTLTVKEKDGTGTDGALKNGNGATIAPFASATALGSTAGWGLAVTTAGTAGVFPAESTNTYKGVAASNAVSTVATHAARIRITYHVENLRESEKILVKDKIFDIIET